MTTTRTEAVVFGAGSVGRGFLGQLFSESGYQVAFADIDEPLIAALSQQGRYTLRLAGIDRTSDVTITPVRGVHSGHLAEAAAAVAGAALLATAVGARALPAVARVLAAGLTRRWSSGEVAPQNIIICENLHDAADVLRELVQQALPAEWRPALRERVGFVPAVIARMSPVPTPEQRAADLTQITAEPYKILPVDREAFVGAVPTVVGLYAVSPFEAYVERKLYIHNAGHAILGYLGYQHGYTYGYEALEDAGVRRQVEQALDESRRALIAEHGFELVSLAEHVADLLTRFANRALGDPISRLARDPLRKLAPGDRLVGAARLAERHGIEPTGLALGIAAALAYDNVEDPLAVELHGRLAGEGVDAVLAEVCQIQPGERLAKLVRAGWEQLHASATR